MAKILIVVCFTFVSSLFAQDNIDLRPEFGPIRDQGQMGLCGSYAAADMLSYWLNNSPNFSFKNTGLDTRTKENMVSGLGYAFAYAAMQNSSALSPKKHNFKRILKQVEDSSKKVNKIWKEHHDANTAVKAIEDEIALKEKAGNTSTDEIWKLKQKIADLLQPELDSDEQYKKALVEQGNAIGRLSEVQFSPLLAKADEGGDLFYDLSGVGICFEKEISSDSSLTEEDKAEVGSDLDVIDIRLVISPLCVESAQGKGALDENRKKLLQKSIKTVFPNLKKRTVDKAVFRSSKFYFKDPVPYLIKKACRFNRVLGDKAPVVKCENDVGTGLIKFIDTQLENKRPVYIAYNSSVFRTPTKSNFSEEGLHASVVVGRLKTDAKKMEYIVRNSYGQNGCTGEYKSYYQNLTEEQEKNLQKEFQEKLDKNCPCTQSSEYEETCVQKYVNEYYEERDILRHKVDRPYRCENGYYIIGKEAFEPVLVSVSWLEDPVAGNKKDNAKK